MILNVATIELDLSAHICHTAHKMCFIKKEKTPALLEGK